MGNVGPPYPFEGGDWDPYAPNCLGFALPFAFDFPVNLLNKFVIRLLGMNGSGFGFGDGSAEAEGLAFVYETMARKMRHT